MNHNYFKIIFSVKRFQLSPFGKLSANKQTRLPKFVTKKNNDNSQARYF